MGGDRHRDGAESDDLFAENGVDNVGKTGYRKAKMKAVIQDTGC